MTAPGFDPAEVLIGGRWLPAADTLAVEDPSTGETFARIARGGAPEIDAAERGRALARIGRRVEERVEDLARLEAADVGKPLTQARADARTLRLSRALRAGQVFLNDCGAGGGVELPFGGVGHSGHGREKGFEALLGFTRLKTVAAWHG